MLMKLAMWARVDFGGFENGVPRTFLGKWMLEF
jgi:hypothetical protein